ncbi:MAG TPA: RNA polymerase sigma factor [Kofleriaceae bacterium]|nr:RNA polymerase sigma factor [Kofleriaceae bacterium]
MTVASPSSPQDLAADVASHHDALYARALRLCGNADQARDLVQDTVERALRRRDTFVAGTNLRAWLMTILSNRFLDVVRRDRIVKVVAIDDRDVAAEPPPPEARVSPEQLRAAVDALPPELREIVTLHALEGLGYRAIADRLRLPMGTVGTRLARARAQLHAALRAAEEAR